MLDKLGCNKCLFYHYRDSVEAGNDIGLMFVDGGRESLEFFRGYNGPLYADGTFFVTPRPFDNLLTVHLEYENHTFPLFYFLLPKRTETMYTAAFNKVVETLAPYAATISFCMTDFETALMKSCERVFHVPVRGCWFHYSQALFKKVRKVGLLHLYGRNNRGDPGDFKKLVHCYMALPLLPPAAIEGAMRELHTIPVLLQPGEQLRLQQFRHYITSFWIRKVTPERMSVFGLKRRSNNAIESFNATLKRKIKQAHPNLFVFIENLNQIISGKLSDLQSIQNGHRLTRRPPRQQLANEERLKVLEDQQSRGVLPPLEFLRKACTTFHRYVDNFDLSDDDAASDNDINDAEVDAPSEGENEEREGGGGEEQNGEREEGDAVDNGPSVCPICLLTPRNAVLNPCGHSACYGCADTVWKMDAPGNKCHECRGEIMSVIRVFGMG